MEERKFDGEAAKSAIWKGILVISAFCLLGYVSQKRSYEAYTGYYVSCSPSVIPDEHWGVTINPKCDSYLSKMDEAGNAEMEYLGATILIPLAWMALLKAYDTFFPKRGRQR